MDSAESEYSVDHNYLPSFMVQRPERNRKSLAAFCSEYKGLTILLTILFLPKNTKGLECTKFHEKNVKLQKGADPIRLVP